MNRLLLFKESREHFYLNCKFLWAIFVVSFAAVVSIVTQRSSQETRLCFAYSFSRDTLTRGTRRQEILKWRSSARVLPQLPSKKRS